MSLQLSVEMKREVMDVLDRLPRPKSNSGKVTALFEFNLDQMGQVASVVAEVGAREQLVRNTKA